MEKAKTPSLSIQSPSKSDADPSVKINLKVLYSHDSPDIRITNVPTETVGTLAHKLMEIDPTDISAAAATLIQSEKVDIDLVSLAEIATTLKKTNPHSGLKTLKTY